MENTCAAVIVAAGSATRMNGIDKIMSELGGIPMILRTVRAMAASDKIDEIVVVTREDLIEKVTKICRGEKKFRKAIPGGSSRAESVMNGILAVNTDLVAIHDGARPFVTTQIIDETVKKTSECGAAAPAVPVRDTIKVAQDHKIVCTPDRSTLFAVQTPQIFNRKQIVSALQDAIEHQLPLTDDCSAAEAAGMEVFLTEGSSENIKITTPVDLAFCEAILKWRERH